MVRVFGLLLLVLSAAGGGAVVYSTSPAMLGWAANLGGLLLFWFFLDVIVRRDGWSVLWDVLATDNLNKAVMVLAGGISFGSCIAGYLFLPILYTLPLSTLLNVIILIRLFDFFMSGFAGWGRMKAWMAEDVRPRVGLVAALAIVDVLLLSLVQLEWGYLPPVLMVLVLAGLAYGSDLLFSRSRIWAVARHMIAEGLRMKIVLVFVVLILVLLPTLPFNVVGDGLTLKSKVQSFFVYSLGALGFLLSLLTVFMACGALSGEIRDKHIIMIASKPIPRWQFFFGKWLGIAFLNAGLLLLAGATIWGFTAYLRTLPTSVADDREATKYEVLQVRHAMKMTMPDVEPLVQERIRLLREEGRLDDTGMQGMASIATETRRGLINGYRSLGPGEGRQYTFKGLIVDRESEAYLQLELKPTAPSGSFKDSCEVIFRAGDPDDPEKTMTPVGRQKLLVDRVNTVVLPVSAVNDEGTVYVMIQNLDPEYTIRFEGDEGMQLWFGLGTFHWNLFRALSIIWCRLAFLAVLGLFMSSWLSYPVACLACFVILAASLMSGFLVDAIDMASPTRGEDPFWIAGPVVRGLAQGVLWVVPNFAEFDPVENVVNGRVVTLMWVIHAFVKLVILRGVLLGVGGCVILSKREVAQVVV